MKKNINQIKLGAIITYITNFFNIIINIALVPIIIRYIGKEEYGLYSLVFSIMMYFSVLDFGFGNAMIRYVSKNKANNQDNKNINSLFFFIYLIIGIIACLIGVILLINFDKIFDQSLTINELHKAKIMMMIFLINVFLSLS